MKSWLATLSFLALAACSDRGPMPRIANTLPGDSSSGLKSYRVIVKNVTTANQITAAPAVDPVASAVNGQAVDSTTALAAMINTGATACYIASQNYTLTLDKQILTNITTSTEVQNGHTIYRTKMTDPLNTTTSSFEITCGRIDMAVSPANVRESLNGILDMTPY